MSPPLSFSIILSIPLREKHRGEQSQKSKQTRQTKEGIGKNRTENKKSAKTESNPKRPATNASARKCTLSQNGYGTRYRDVHYMDVLKKIVESATN